MILNDFDNNKKAIINPEDVTEKIPNFPKIGVACFSRKIINKYVELYNPEQIAEIKNANGSVPVYKINYEGIDIAMFMANVGSATCIMGIEDVIAMGLEKLVLFGTCGVLDKDIEDISIIIPTSAIRDEGVSYHYAVSSDEIELDKDNISLLESVLNKHNYKYTKGKTWTTDAPYRETIAKMNKRKEQGCIAVEMECASVVAVSKFRNIDLIQFFYAADNLDGSKWDKRSLGCDDRLSDKEKIMLLAFECAKEMSLRSEEKWQKWDKRFNSNKIEEYDDICIKDKIEINKFLNFVKEKFSSTNPNIDEIINECNKDKIEHIIISFYHTDKYISCQVKYINNNNIYLNDIDNYEIITEYFKK